MREIFGQIRKIFKSSRTTADQRGIKVKSGDTLKNDTWYRIPLSDVIKIDKDGKLEIKGNEDGSTKET